MTSRKLGLCLTPPPPSATLKWMFYLVLYTLCHKCTKPPSPFRDVIYEWHLGPFREAVVGENFIECYVLIIWCIGGWGLALQTRPVLKHRRSKTFREGHFGCFFLLEIKIGHLNSQTAENNNENKVKDHHKLNISVIKVHTCVECKSKVQLRRQYWRWPRT